MSPRRLRTRTASRTEGVGRYRVAEKYLEIAELSASEDGAAINVTVGLAVLAGIAACDAICVSAHGERYAGADHAGAAELLARIDPLLGVELAHLIALKPGSHYGDSLLSPANRLRALRAARRLVNAARNRSA